MKEGKDLIDKLLIGSFLVFGTLCVVTILIIVISFIIAVLNQPYFIAQ